MSVCLFVIKNNFLSGGGEFCRRLALGQSVPLTQPRPRSRALGVHKEGNHLRFRGRNAELSPVIEALSVCSDDEWRLPINPRTV